jgi:hypothetical protein
MMNAYMASADYATMVSATLKKMGKGSVDEDCREALELIFRGQWVYPTRLQLTLMINAFQNCDEAGSLAHP